jgi:hypothetical protein
MLLAKSNHGLRCGLRMAVLYRFPDCATITNMQGEGNNI